MTTLAADPKHLAHEIGMVAVLHTWGQTLSIIHIVHCVVPGGGSRPMGRAGSPAGRTSFCRQGALTPLSSPVPERLRAAFDRRASSFFGDLAHLADPSAFAALLAAAQARRLGRLSKRPFGGPAKSSPISAAIPIASPSPTAASKTAMTIMSPLPGKTTATAARVKTMRLKPDEFIRRFLLHVLTRWLPSHPPLRLPRQWPSNAKARPLSLAPDRRGRTDDARKDKIANIRAERNRRP